MFIWTFILTVTHTFTLKVINLSSCLTLCNFDECWTVHCRAICGEKEPPRCYTMVYWTYNPLKMFRALLCPSSGARDYTVGYSMWHETLCCSSNIPLLGHIPYSSTPDQRPATNKVSRATCRNHLYSLELLKMGIIVPETW